MKLEKLKEFVKYLESTADSTVTITLKGGLYEYYTFSGTRLERGVKRAFYYVLTESEIKSKLKEINNE